MMAISTRFYQADEPFSSMWSLDEDEDDFFNNKEEWTTTKSVKTPYYHAWFSAEADNNANSSNACDSRVFREHHEADCGPHMNGHSFVLDEIDVAAHCSFGVGGPKQPGEDRDDKYSNSTEMNHDAGLWRLMGQHQTFEDKKESTIRRLADSMRRSQETRVSLAIRTPAMARYPRSNSIDHVLHCVEKSSLHLLSSLREGQEAVRRHSS
jgi:hypothetical protein